MRVLALDHVNIVCTDLDASARFYVDVLGMERRDPPEPLEPHLIQWMHDGDGRAVMHLVSTDRPDNNERGSVPGTPTGALHHVALECSGYDALLERLDRMDIAFRTSGVSGIGLRQVFLTDPGNVLLELNFRGP